ncbi:MAG: MaoC family dehydratase [Burkholderiales bacterium]
MNYKYYWEDFKAGENVELGEKRVSREEIIAFARAYDPQPFHIDEQAARQSFFGGLIASGWHTCAMLMRIMCDAFLLESASMGSPGVDNIRWLKPVRPDDVIRVRRVCLETRASQSRPEMGVIKNRYEVYNQNDELVMQIEAMSLIRRRHPGARS